MKVERPIKSISLLLAVCFIVVALALGVAMNKRGSSESLEQTTAKFNASLLEYNREIHQGESSQIVEDLSNEETADRLASSRDSEVNKNPDASSTNIDDAFVGKTDARPDFIKPVVGEIPVQSETPKFPWLDPSTSVAVIADAARDRNLEREIYGWIQFQSNTKPSQLQAMIAQYGAEVISTNARYVRVKLPGDRQQLANIAELPVVEGMGLMPVEAKIPPTLMGAFDNISSGSEVPVFITTMGSDNDGSMRRQLIAMGATVGQWESDIRTYSANVDRITLDSVLSADFVEVVSPNTVLRPFLAGTTSDLGVDLYRTYSASTGTFSGDSGFHEGLTIGVMDTGINANHRDFSGKSICARSFVHSDPPFLRGDARIDAGLHGTHVSGIATGGGKVDPSLAGVAPGVDGVRVAKVLNSGGVGDTLMYFNGVNFHSSYDPCDDPRTAARARVINVSLGGFTPETDGTSILSRKMDAASYQNGQNYVISAGNSGRVSLGDTSSTKSAMSVGATTDSGVITLFSSHGPTTDGRLFPHIVAPGFRVESTLGNGSEDGFLTISGTSMSSPAVAGLATVFIASNPDTAANPAVVRASLMASAIKPRRWIGSSDNFPMNNTDGPGDIQAEYGLGFASLVAFESEHADHDSMHGELDSDEMASQTITVPEGTSRLDIVLAWNENAPSALGTTVLSDLNLYLDRDADCESSACGEYSSQSKIDSVEWLLIKDPEPGTYELKVVPENSFDEPVLFGATWVMLADDDPELSITANMGNVSLASGDRLELELSVESSAYVATGTTVHVMCRKEPSEEPPEEGEEPVNDMNCPDYLTGDVTWLPGTKASRGDGTVSDFSLASFAEPVHIGAITSEHGRDLTLRVPASVIAEVGPHTLYFVATSWNGKSASTAVEVIVDGSFDVHALASTPTNDAIDDAMSLTGDADVLDVDLILATRESGEPMLRPSFADEIVKIPLAQRVNVHNSFDIEFARNNSVWYRVDTSTDAELLTFGSIPDGVGVSIYRHPATRSSIVADNWSAEPESGKKLFANLEPSTTYLVQVYAHENVVPFKLPWQKGVPQPPVNDDFANPTTVARTNFRISGTNYTGSLEAFETYNTFFTSSTWFAWTPGSSGAYRFNIVGDAEVVVYNNPDDPVDLLRISTVPSYIVDEIYAYVARGETYVIGVISDANDDTLKGYWLEVSKVPPHVFEGTVHAMNDNFAEAEVVGSDRFVAINDQLGGTVEPSEPEVSVVGTRWWRWTAETTGTHTFTLITLDGNIASVFGGESLENLKLLGQGQDDFSADFVAGTQYHISIGRTQSESFLDYLYAATYFVIPRLEWGPTPANDTVANRIALTDDANSTTYSHAYATVSEGEFLPGMTNSLWWEWSPSVAGWYQFETAHDPSRPWYFRSTDSVVIVHRQTDNKRIATSDISYFLTGHSEATFHATPAHKYLIQIALRTGFSDSPLAETSLTWQPVGTPPWSRYVGKYSNAHIDSDAEIPALAGASSVTTNSAGDKVFVNADGGIAVFDVGAEADTRPTHSNQVAHADASGDELEGLGDALLHWLAADDMLYAISANGIWLVQDHDSDDGYVEHCSANDETFTRIHNVVFANDGKFLYVLGAEEGVEGPFDTPYSNKRMAIFERTASCAFTQSGSMDEDDLVSLASATDMVASADAGHLYVSSDDELEVLARDADTGALTSVTTKSVFERDRYFYSDWRDSSVVRSPATPHLWVIGRGSPHVAVYDLTAPEDPQLIHSISDYYLVGVFSSFDPSAQYPNQCRAVAAQTTTTAVDFACAGQGGRAFTAYLDETDSIVLADQLVSGNTDRFGRKLTGFGFSIQTLTNVGARPMSQSLYVLDDGAIDSLGTFDHVENVKGDPYQ